MDITCWYALSKKVIKIKNKRTKICINLPTEMVEIYKKTKERTGVTISKQIEMELRGYKMVMRWKK